MNKPKYGGLNYPIGCKVIIKSNEPTPYQVGILKRVEIIGNDQFELPIVEVEGVEYGVMGIIRKYDERRVRALDKLTPDEQWNVMAEFHMVGALDPKENKTDISHLENTDLDAEVEKAKAYLASRQPKMSQAFVDLANSVNFRDPRGRPWSYVVESDNSGTCGCSVCRGSS